MEKLTAVELQIMRCIWDYNREVRPIEVRNALNERFHKVWPLQSVCTYLIKMAGKGYLKYRKENSITTYASMITESDYLKVVADDLLTIWDKDTLLTAIQEVAKSF